MKVYFMEGKLLPTNNQEFKDGAVAGKTLETPSIFVITLKTMNNVGGTQIASLKNRNSVHDTEEIK